MHSKQDSASLHHPDMLRGVQQPRVVLTLHNMDNSGECSQEEFCYSGAFQ
jgi:hypothetical protein